MVAKEMPGTPIKLLWSREEDMLHGWYHPVTQCKMTAGLDANNNLTAIHYRISGQSILARVRPGAMQDGADPATFSGFYPKGEESTYGYTVPNILADHSMRNPHLNPGFWRGVNINHNAIYIECFMDEVAKAAGIDALEFRRKLMANHPKHLAVLNAVADKGDWGKPAAAGVHRGLAQAMAFGSYVAACAEVSVTGNKVKIHRIVAATDPGYAVNPAQIERQVSGSFVYGLTGLFLGGITVKDGKVEQENFDTYDMMRIAEMPKVETIVMPSGGFWGGVGEPTICVAAPAVLNAIAAATGKRYRSVPLKDHGLTLA
jgi:isoquinoline 1-oxidoreductase beta subunit